MSWTMQNALSIVPITVPASDIGPMPTAQGGCGFAFTLSEKVADLGHADQSPDGSDVIPAVPVLWNERLLVRSAPASGTAKDGFAQDSAVADQTDGLPDGWGGLLQAFLPIATDTGTVGGQGSPTSPEPGRTMPSAGGTDPSADPIPVRPTGADWTLDIAGSLADDHPVAPTSIGSSHLPVSQQVGGAGSDPKTPAGEARPPSTSFVLIPAGSDGSAANDFHFRHGMNGTTDAADGLQEPALPAERLLGTGPAARPEPGADTPGKSEVGFSDVRNQPRTPDTLVAWPELAESLPVHPALASGSRKTGANLTAQPVPSEPGQVPPAGPAFGPAQTASGSQTSGSVWERVFLDTTRDQAAGSVLPVKDTPADDPTGPVTVLPSGTAGPVPVAVPASADPRPVPVSLVTSGASWIRASRPEPLAATSLAMWSAEGTHDSPDVGIMVEPWPDPGPDRGSASEGLPALAVIGSSPVPASPNAAKTDPAPHLLTHVAVQLAAVLHSGSGGVTELALAPAELGRVRLRMEPDARDPDRLVVVVTVERPETLDLFRRHAGELADAIRNAGFSGSSIGFAHYGEDGPPDNGREDRENRSFAASEDEPATQTPTRHVLGETLDLRL